MADPYGPKFSHAVFLENFTKSYDGAPLLLEGWRPLLRGILDPQLLSKMTQNKLSMSGGGNVSV